MTTQATEPSRQEPPSTDSARQVRPDSDFEPGLLSMIAAALALLVAVSVVLWTASSVPNGPSVVVTIRNA